MEGKSVQFASSTSIIIETNSQAPKVRVLDDLAEINAIEHKPMYIADYVEQLDSILSSR